MTAVNVICTPTAALIFSDGAVEIMGKPGAGELAKTFPLPHCRAAYVARGDHTVQMAVLLAGNMAGGLDAIGDGLPGVIRRTEALFRDQFAGQDPAGSQHLVAGWSDRLGRFVAYCYTTEPTEGIPLRELLTLPEVYISPAVDVPALASLDAADLDSFGLEVLRRQRDAYPAKVGGFAQLTTVTGDRIEMRILERWPSPVALAA